MADQADFDHSGLQEVANAVRDTAGVDEIPGGSTQKRKRSGSADATGRPRVKRGSPQDVNDANESFMEGPGDGGVESLQDYGAIHQQQHPSENGAGDHANASSTAAAALVYNNLPTLTVPQSTENAFAAQVAEADRNQDSFMDDSQVGNESFSMEGSGGQSGNGRSGSGSKPAVGSEEWHKVRKDNHKEVERRRRETINEGINELAKIVPGCEKNKGSILQRAVSFITQLKENEAQNIEKWTLEKLLTEQAIAELSASNDKLKTECERAWREVETWKKTCQSAGLAPKKEDAGGSAEI
ncbi:MAG: basic helix-loop-helix protein [Claussenomyces sp. TS43310]|nr:MAG: basic helix-loop-helix protein [Claussenomyces sp. TS43310]